VQLAREVRARTEPRHGPERAGDIRDSLADITAARRALGFEVRIPFSRGLKGAVAALPGASALV